MRIPCQGKSIYRFLLISCQIFCFYACIHPLSLQSLSINRRESSLLFLHPSVALTKVLRGGGSGKNDETKEGKERGNDDSDEIWEEDDEGEEKDEMKEAELEEQEQYSHEILIKVVDKITAQLSIAITYFRTNQQALLQLPTHLINFLIGAVFCFFGGLFPVLFSTVKAAEYGGRKIVLDATRDLIDEAAIILEESEREDDNDHDNDHLELLIAKKAMLVLRKMNPEKVDNALRGIYGVWLSVAAVLSLEFARTISMALAISDFMKRPIDRFIFPSIEASVSEDYQKWVPVVLGWASKSVAMSIAWYINTVKAALASAMTGGTIMARSTYQELQYRKITLNGLVKDNPDDTFLDEGLSYFFAAIGLYFQINMVGFGDKAPPFPLNLIFLPFEVSESVLRWSFTFAKSVPN